MVHSFKESIHTTQGREITDNQAQFQVPKQMSPVVMVRRRWSLTLCVRVAQTFNQMASGSIHHTSQYFFSRPVCILIANQLELSVPSSHNFHPSQGVQARLEQTQQLHHLMRGSFNTSVYAKWINGVLACLVLLHPQPPLPNLRNRDGCRIAGYARSDNPSPCLGEVGGHS